MEKLFGRVHGFIKENRLAGRGDKILIAFSGGADSVFLCLALNEISAAAGFETALCHVNHQLRGAESESDEEFCRKFAAGLKIPFFAGKADVKNYCSEHGYSTEMGARKLRYSILKDFAAVEGCNLIATGHNSDDNAETFVMSLLWGSRIGGLAGIPLKNRNIIRPLLSITGAEIREFLDTNGIEYRSDSTNKDLSFRRNKVRHEVLPYLRSVNPGILNNILNRTEYFNELRRFSEKRGLKLALKVIKPPENGVLTVPHNLVKRFGGLSYDEIIKYSIKKYFNVNLSFVNLKLIKNLTRLDAGKEINLTGGLRIINDRDNLRVMVLKQSQDFSVSFDCGKTAIIPGGQLISELTGTFRASGSRNSEIIALKEECRLTVRNARPGDSFRPLGMRGKQKISDFATNLKIPKDEKEKLKVLLAGDEIIWLVGYRISNDFKVTEKSKILLKIEFIPDGKNSLQ